VWSTTQLASATVTNDAMVRAPSATDAIATGGYGLTGMRERLELPGGRLLAGLSFMSLSKRYSS